MFLVRIFLFLVVLLQGNDIALAETVPTVHFDQTMRNVDLLPSLEILPDPDHLLTIDDLMTAGRRDDFKPAALIGNNFGFSKAAYWVRFSLHMDHSLPDSLLLQLEYPLIDRVELFVPDGQGRYTERATGDTLLFSKREVQYRTCLFRLPAHRGETRTYYMRLQTEGSMQIPLSLWTSDAFIEHIDNFNFVLGGYYGIMLLLMLAALASYVKIRDRLFLFYALYLLSYLFFQLSMNGFSCQYLWPESPGVCSLMTAASAGLVVICGLLFSGSFLQLWSNGYPRIRFLFYLLIAGGATGVLLSLFGNYALAVQVSTISGVFLPPVVLVGTICSLMSGYRPARYFLVAWCVFLIGVFVAGLLYLGLVPHNFVTFYAMQIGSTLEVMLLGYALMDRIELLRTEKEKAIVQANEYLQQLNEKLESLVDERTQKLREKNRKLSKLAVQDSMTGLLNHNASIEYLKLMRGSAQRYGHDLAVIMLDIDLFKSINDVYGHPAGDEVILAVSHVLKSTIRESDGCGRYGGEEFILILPESNMDSAQELAERIRKNIQELRIPAIDNTTVSASFGITLFDQFASDADMIAQADKALYMAKMSGRNRVVLAEAVGG